MKRIALIVIFFISSCATVSQFQGPLPEKNYTPEIGFGPMDEALTEFLPVINDSVPKNYESIAWLWGDNRGDSSPARYRSSWARNPEEGQAWFQRCYGREIPERLKFLLLSEGLASAVIGFGSGDLADYCRVMAFSDSGLYVSGCNRGLKKSNPNCFISFDDLYNKNTVFRVKRVPYENPEVLPDWAPKYYEIFQIRVPKSIESINTMSNVISYEDYSLPTVKTSHGETNQSIMELYVRMFSLANHIASTDTYKKIGIEEIFRMEAMPKPLINLFKSNQDEWYTKLYFNGEVPKESEATYRRCMDIPNEEVVLLIIQYNKENCNGLVATQSGIHVKNQNEETFYYMRNKFIPYSYYKNNLSYSASLTSDGSVGSYSLRFRGLATNVNKAIELQRDFKFELYGYSEDERDTIGFLLMLLIDAVQGKNMPSSEELQKMVSEYKVSVTEKRIVANNSTKSFFKSIGDVLMPIIQIATVLAIADSLGEGTCDIPRMPRASQNYGSQMLNRQALSRPNDFNKQMNVYNKRAANAKSHCDDKRKDLGLLLSLIN